MNDTIKRAKSTSKRWTADQIAAAVAACPPANLVLDVSPPCCNTGVETDSVPKRGSKEALVDYLRFVVKDVSTLDWWLDFLGGSRANWVEKDRGFYGYTRSYWLSNIVILTDGGGDNGAEMGFCIQMSGAGCREFEATFGDRTKITPFAWGWQYFLHRLAIAKPGEGAFPGTVNITRLDVALDDRSGSLDLDLVKQSTLDGHFSCRGGDSITESPCRVQDSKKRGAARRGLTIEFGRKSSTQMVRIYDKAVQMASKGGQVVGDWLRAEYQANGERAQLLAQLVALQGLRCVPGIIRGYLDFKRSDHGYSSHDRYRAETAGWWLAFLEQFEKLTFTLRPLVQTVEGVRRWLEYQCAVGVALVHDAASLLGLGTGRGFLDELTTDGRNRFRPKHLRMLAQLKHRQDLVTLPDGSTGF